MLHYLEVEVKHGAIAGPLTNTPINNLRVSPFMTGEKSSSVHKRVIINLSWPIGQSVYSGVASDKYLDSEFALTYNSNKGCEIFKVDTSRAFIHAPIGPRDLGLLGPHWEGYFIDYFLPFVFKHGSYIFSVSLIEYVLL